MPIAAYSQQVRDTAVITRVGEIYDECYFSPLEQSIIKIQLGQEEFNRINNTCGRTAWPPTMQNNDSILYHADAIEKYVAYRVYTFIDYNKYILQIPYEENQFQPKGLRPTQTFYIVIGAGSVVLNPAKTKVPEIAVGTRVLVSNYGKQFSWFILAISPEDENMIRTRFGNALWADIKAYSIDDNYPPAIKVIDDRLLLKDKMRDYTVEYVCHIDFARKIIVKAPVAKNSHMTGGFALTHDIYFIMDASVVEILN